MLALGRITLAVVLLALLVSGCRGHSAEARSTLATTGREARASRPAAVGIRPRVRQDNGATTQASRRYRRRNGKLITCQQAQKVMRRFLVMDRGRSRFSAYRP
jgi:hypothetical protein